VNAGPKAVNSRSLGNPRDHRVPRFGAWHPTTEDGTLLANLPSGKILRSTVQLRMQIGPKKRAADILPSPSWGPTPWSIDFRPAKHSLPAAIDIAIIGGGFTGLAAAAWSRRCDSTKSVAVFEADGIGAGASGHTGGLVLAETAAGDLPGLGDVLAGFSSILRELSVEADLALPGVWELRRDTRSSSSAIAWKDSGTLRVSNEVLGGTIDPGKLVSGLGRAAEQRGAQIFEHARVENIEFTVPLTLTVSGRKIQAQRALVATNAMSLELGALEKIAEPKLTLALATEPLTDSQFREIGLLEGKPFYTEDLPYLWGRQLSGNRAIFGSGLVDVENWRDLYSVDVRNGRAGELMARLEKRVRGLHPALNAVNIPAKWGGPILIAGERSPMFTAHQKDSRVVVLGAYSGHGVALSSYLGSWAAEAMLGRRNLPKW
jgi:glycine/D-amino acid oxidase-like deaminating enzyme